VRPRLPPIVRTPHFVAVPFRVPAPGTPLQTYIAVPRISTHPGSPFAVGQRIERNSGVVVGNEPWTAVWECKRWPFRLYEIAVDPRDVIVGQGEMLLKTVAFRVVRELGLDEVLGARASDVEALFDALRCAPWLAPARSVDLSAVASLVQDFYARAAAHVRVRALPVGIVRHWGDATNADRHATHEPASAESLMSLTEALRDVVIPPDASDDAWGIKLSLHRIALHQHFARAWDAGWQAGSEHCLRESAKAVRPGDAKGAKRAWAKLREQITDRRDSARRSATQEATRMLAGPTSAEELDEPDAEPAGGTRDALERAVGFSEVSRDAWNFALPVIATAMDAMDAALTCIEGSPFSPLFDLFRMGVWPIGPVQRMFVVYIPDPHSTH
jgi:hypothetical protein